MLARWRSRCLDRILWRPLWPSLCFAVRTLGVSIGISLGLTVEDVQPFQTQSWSQKSICSGHSTFSRPETLVSFRRASSPLAIAVYRSALDHGRIQRLQGRSFRRSLATRWPTYAASCNIQRAHGQKHKNEDRKNWSSLKGKENPWPDEKCLILFTFLCVSVGTHGKAWKNQHSYKSTKKQSFQNVRLLSAGAFVLDYLSKNFSGCRWFCQWLHVWPNQSFTESSLSNMFRPFSMSCSVDRGTHAGCV